MSFTDAGTAITNAGLGVQAVGVGGQLSQAGTAAITTASQGQVTNPGTTNTKVAPTQGWYVFAGIITGIALSSTRAAPLVMGILSIALIYQVSALLEGIPPSSNPVPSLSSLIKK